MLSQGNSKASASRRRPPACERCRGKKLKCDGAKPSCHTCSRHGIECIPRTVVELPRPTKRRILQLEEENRRLREDSKLGQLVVRENPPRIRQSSEIAGHSVDEASSTSEREQSIERRRILKEGGEILVDTSVPTRRTTAVGCPAAESPETNQSSYHGPTSVLFDEASRANYDDSRKGRSSSTNVEWARCSLVAETAKQRQLEDINLAQNILDFDGLEPELGMQLLSLYWSRQLHAGLIVYRTVFMRDMACGGPYFSKLLLNAMYYSVSKHSPDLSIRQEAADIATAGWSFRQRFCELLHDEYDKSSITTIQALLIMASSIFTRCDERSASWLYAGNAFNMIIDMGLHAVPPTSQKMTEEESEIRTRVFWSAYMIDKIQCLYQGRQPCLRISDTNVPLLFADDYEEFEKFDSISFCGPGQVCTLPSYNISMLKALCELSIIMERIHNKVYAVGHLTQSSDVLCEETLALDLELKAWRTNLPPHLDFVASKTHSHPLPYNLSMLAVYNLLVILVHQLLLSESRSFSAPHNVAYNGLIMCITAAKEITHILQVYEKLYNPSSATFSLSYATYISAKIHVHILARHGNQFGTFDSLYVCLVALDKHQNLYSTVRRAKIITEKLMARMGVKVGDNRCFCAPTTCLSSDAHGSKDCLENSRAGIHRPGNSTGSGISTLNSTAPPTPIPNLNPLDFDANDTMQSFRTAPSITEGWLDVPQYMISGDLY